MLQTFSQENSSRLTLLFFVAFLQMHGEQCYSHIHSTPGIVVVVVLSYMHDYISCFLFTSFCNDPKIGVVSFFPTSIKLRGDSFILWTIHDFKLITDYEWYLIVGI